MPSTIELAVLENDVQMLREILTTGNNGQAIDFACTMVDSETFNKNVFHIIAEY